MNFMLFTSVWTLLCVAYLVLAPSRFPAAAHKYAIAGVEALTMLFWFAAFVAGAVRWNSGVLADKVGRQVFRTWYQVGVAAVVFAAFTW